jgi:hypothetical protein
VPADPFGDQCDALDRQRGDGGGRHVERDAGVHQGAEQQVARGARRQVQPPDGHAAIMPGERRRGSITGEWLPDPPTRPATRR